MKAHIAAGKHKSHVTLSLDEMPIKKAFCYDTQLKKYMGFMDFPEEKLSSIDNDPHQLLATHVLMLYAVRLDKKCRSPVAYFFTNHLTRLG